MRLYFGLFVILLAVTPSDALFGSFFNDVIDDVYGLFGFAVDGKWGSWASWSSCSKPCGTGTRSRTQKCDNPSPKNGGSACVYSYVNKQTVFCNQHACPINGQFGQWTAWGSCSVTCGNGNRKRTRKCDSPSPKYNGKACVGSTALYQLCNESPCPVNGGWTDWEKKSDCSKTCGGGEQRFERTCTNPKPQYKGLDCIGSSFEMKKCNTFGLVDGEWQDWTKDGECSKPCGGGIQRWIRKCIGPYYGGKPCEGDSAMEKDCNVQNCPVNGGWSDWGMFSSCSKPCGKGTKYRIRTCTNPEPMYEGADCEGVTEETVDCNTEECPKKVNGGWGNWTDWTECSVTCGDGVVSRKRVCDNPAPENGGDGCEGNDLEYKEESCGSKCETEIDPSFKVYLEKIIELLLGSGSSLPPHDVLYEKVQELISASNGYLLTMDENALPDQIYKAMFELDVNGDGVITIDEAQTILDLLGGTDDDDEPDEEDEESTDEKILKMAYDLFDKNKDQTLTVKEITKVLRSMKVKQLRKLKLGDKTEQELKDFILKTAKEVDENQDYVISETEKNEYFRKKMCSKKGPFCGKDFKRYENMCDMFDATGSWRNICGRRCMKKAICGTIVENDVVTYKEFANKCEARASKAKIMGKRPCLYYMCLHKVETQICDTKMVTYKDPCSAYEGKAVFASLGPCKQP